MEEAAGGGQPAKVLAHKAREERAVAQRAREAVELMQLERAEADEESTHAKLIEPCCRALVAMEVILDQAARCPCSMPCGLP